MLTDSRPVIGEGLDRQAWRTRLLMLRDFIPSVTATAESPDGLITATVGGLGELLDLRIDPRIYRVTDSRRVAAQITGVVHEATRQARARIAGRLADIVSARRS